MRKSVALFLAAFLWACTAPLDTPLDASTEEAYQKSISKIRSKLPPEESKKLEQAIQIVVLSTAMPNDGGLIGMLAMLKEPDKLEGQMLQAVNGKTPRQLIAQADQITKERAKAELKSVAEEIADLQKRRSLAEQGKALLAGFVVENARYYWTKSEFLPQPVLDFKVTNRSGTPVSRLFFHGVVSTPGRTIPWIEDDFNYEVPGGLEAGETKHLGLVPNMFSKWGEKSTQGRNDLVLSVAVINVAGADKKRLVEEFSPKDSERLSALLTKQKELAAKLQ